MKNNSTSGSGNGHKKTIQFTHPPKRIVSLVPSLTESMFDLGLGEAIVGITDYCIRPTETVKRLPRLGGPKDPHLDEIIQLKPDLVLANQEENTLKDVETLENAGIKVWVSFPKTIRQSVDTLWALAGIFQSRVAVIRIETLELTLDWAEEAVKSEPVIPYFCPIWCDQTEGGVKWWMTFNENTYANDVLRLMGGNNIFSRRQRLYPLEADLGIAPAEEAGERDTRYPRIPLIDLQNCSPEVILLPSEPYGFKEQHVDEFYRILPESAAVRNNRIRLVDGSLFTWPVTRLARALRELPGIFS